MKKVSGTLKIDLAQYRSLEAFAMFASDLDAASRQQLTRGARLMELLKQPQYSPYPIEEQVVSIWAGTKGKLDRLPLPDVLVFERQLLDHLRRNTKILDQIASTGVLSDDLEAELGSAVDDYLSTFTGGGDSELTTKTTVADGVDVEVEQDKIVRRKTRA
jgi:F-type H+-transporting ATPase subunit alpha